MIDFLNGIITEKHPPELVIDVNGMGYSLTASMNTFYHLPDIGEKIKIYTHLVVREDAHTLFAFGDKQERNLFRSLIKVNGVGPKLAITILSSINANDFVLCIQQNDVSALVRLPGIGKKTAERLVIDMRDRLKDWQVSNDVASKVVNPTKIPAVEEAIGALISLGYKPQEAKQAINHIEDNSLSSEALIRQGLKNLIN